jgi:phage terminase large subunit GpA-like protein
MSASLLEIPDKTHALGEQLAGFLKPPPKLLVSEWADQNRVLPEASAHPGQWHTSLTPYLKEPMDACCDPTIERVVMMFGSQLGKSECLLNIMGYYIDCDPAAIMMVQPSKEKAQQFSKTRLAPMLADSPCLAKKIAPSRSRDSGNTILHKTYPGGFIVLVGSNAPGDLASWPIRILLMDEIDRFEVSAGTEGDQIGLAERRMESFWNHKSILCSSPTNLGESRIWTAYEDSTQELWHAPCPSCGELQPFDWGRLQFDSVEMCCLKCGSLHNEFEWKAQPGVWVAQAEHASTRGFSISGMASPWKHWDKAIAEFKEKKDKAPEIFKVFVNTYLNELFEEKGETLDDVAVTSRTHQYGADVPNGVSFLTCGVDVQGDRIEAQVEGWGWGRENWKVEYRVFLGDPHLSQVWNELDEFLQQTYERADGQMLPILGTAVDSGYVATEVYKFCRTRDARFIYAIKGKGGPGLPLVNKPRLAGKPGANCWLFPVGSDAGKDLIFTRLQVEEEGPGYTHFPSEPTFGDGRARGFDEKYFDGLTKSEHRVRRLSKGIPYHTWQKRGSHARNEALDTAAYAAAALEIRGRAAKLDMRPREVESQRSTVSGQAPAKPAAQTTGKRPVKSRLRVLSRGK